jgi:hypothetical protein
VAGIEEAGRVDQRAAGCEDPGRLRHRFDRITDDVLQDLVRYDGLEGAVWIREIEEGDGWEVRSGQRSRAPADGVGEGLGATDAQDRGGEG